jgi:peroxiredoxin Q/BCP
MPQDIQQFTKANFNRRTYQVMKQVPYQAPNFSLPDQTGTICNLADYAGKWLVLYFYPKDATPGCTTEACSFRDGRDDIAKQANAEIVGISMDEKDSHAAFASQHRLTFPLLSDPDKTVIEAYGAWGKKMYGREGILRKTFLIDPHGIVQKVYGNVSPDAHAEHVLQDLLQLQQTTS